MIAAVLVALGVGGYFGFVALSNYQDKANSKRREVEKQSDGGEMGHVANLYDVLDATEPGGRRGGGGSGRHISAPGSSKIAAARTVTIGAEGASRGGDYEDADGKPLPLIAPVWTLDIASAKIPDSRANGSIGGAKFEVELARMVPSSDALVLSLSQGIETAPDRDVMIYLHLKPGEKLAGHSWTITKDMKTADVPQVLKRWKPSPQAPMQQLFFKTGYAMRLELGAPANGVTPGKVFLALPDPEQTVVAGTFRIGEY
jgi:hypothetical protein